ncbi:MAG TPA: hypothetical protein VHB48_10165 [Chitinophagaceae bacterium]|jgi:hypothetical protein|nr:hypothetical protein [Chitinophagaceae bacterium]
MKVLVSGPSGLSKSYITRALQKTGIKAFDDGDIAGLSAWHNRSGQKAEAPVTTYKALAQPYRQRCKLFRLKGR